jgi:hypothetical protein
MQATGYEKIGQFSCIIIEKWRVKQVEEIVKNYVEREHLRDNIMSVWLSDSGTSLG